MLLAAPPAPPRSAPSDIVAPSGIAPTDAGTGRELLALLRGTTTKRPRFDPGLAGGLRAWLEDAAYEVVSERGEQARPLVLGPHQLLGTAGGGDERQLVAGTDDAEAEGTQAALVSRLVHALFRQLVHTGGIGDPFTDALAALRVSGAVALAQRIESLTAAQRTTLSETVARHAGNLQRLVPRFAPGWMPRTDDRVAIPLAGGRVVLQGSFDLLVGVPQPGTASLCALGLSTGGPWPRERRTLHYLALLETLRGGTPPFRLALIESASGRYGVEDVRDEHLRAVASHIVAWLARRALVHG